MTPQTSTLSYVAGQLFFQRLVSRIAARIAQESLSRPEDAYVPETNFMTAAAPAALGDRTQAELSQIFFGRGSMPPPAWLQQMFADFGGPPPPPAR